MLIGAVRMSDSRIGMVMAAIRKRIASRSATSGSRLPSVRSMAKTMSVSVSTVVEAYARLTAEGLISSRPGSGFYVANHTMPVALSAIGPKLDRVVDPFWISRQSLEAGEGTLRPGCGWLPPSWLPEQAIRRALRTMSRSDVPSLAEYGTPLGSPPMRQLLSRRLADQGVEASPDQIVLTESGTHSIDLLCRLLLEKGDAVLIDDPCYFNFQALLRAHPVRLVSVPYTPNGPDVAVFAAALDQHKPRLYITNSGIHNPTGATLSPAVGHRVLKLADAYGLMIIEDDIFGDFEDYRAPRLAALDGLDRVIQVGSFSKTLSAAFRCGYIVTKRDWIEGLTDLKIATTFGGSPLNAELTLSALTDSSYPKHLEGLRRKLATARHDVGDKLRGLGVESWIEPEAGMFLWCKLPEGLDAAVVARAALTRNVVLAPGNAFSLRQQASSYLRFNVSQSMDRKVFDTLARIMGT